MAAMKRSSLAKRKASDFIPVISFVFLINFSLLVHAEFQLGNVIKVPCPAPDAGYDITNLTSGYWKYTQKNEKCIGSRFETGKSLKSNCTYLLAFCKPVMSVNCTSSSVCVSTYNGTGGNNTQYYNAGTYSAAPFIKTTEDVYGGFEAFFKGQDIEKPLDPTKSCKIQTTIHFECDNTIAWNAHGSEDIQLIPHHALINAKFDAETCKYDVTFKYAGACVSIVPATPVKHLSAGTVLIIIFFCGLGLYFIVGVCFNCLRGYRGEDLLPHSQFWTTLPVLIADGCLFTCRCCQNEEKSAYDSI